MKKRWLACVLIMNMALMAAACGNREAVADMQETESLETAEETMQPDESMEEAAIEETVEEVDPAKQNIVGMNLLSNGDFSAGSENWGAYITKSGVAEFTVAQILLANKGAFLCREVIKREGYESARKHACCYEGNLNSRVGVLGVGNVGRKVIEYLKPFQVEVLACDPNLTPAEARKMGVELVSMEELFTNCNVVTCHLQNSVATEKLITYEYLSMMGDHTTFINNGDGNHMVHEDLARACRENPTLTALIDKTEPVNTDPAGLLELPNVFRTPLIAGSMGNEVSRMGQYVYEQCRKMIEAEDGNVSVAI